MAKVREKLVRNGNDAATWVDYGNLLWGEGREVLASLAYDRALGLSPKLPAALNNRAVILLSNDGQSEPFKAIEANLLLRQALARDEFFLAAKMNRAALLNYYRLFSQSKPIWDQILLKAAQQYDAWDGLGTALLALGDSQGAQEAFEKSTNLGGAERRFSRLFHLAVLEAKKGAVGAAECLSLLGKLSGAELIGFERESVDYLKRGCERWKERK
jgi:Flp pilus assembly protein TadD